jgi:hypothetical protein
VRTGEFSPSGFYVSMRRSPSALAVADSGLL